MILTKDNILRFVKERKAVTPTIIAENFDTSTMIASAALSELAKDKLIGITELKLSSSPYYYDLSQKEYLYELGLKHFSGYEKEVLIKLKEQEVLNLNALSIQESLAVERIKDFAKPLEIEHSGKILKFYVWYLRNLTDTKKQIEEALSGKLYTKNNSSSSKKINEDLVKSKQVKTQENKIQINKIVEPHTRENYSQQSNQQQQFQHPLQQQQFGQQYSQQQQFQPKDMQQNQTENFIDNYFRQNYLQVESKTKDDKTIIYSATLQINKINVVFDCIYYTKKPTEFDIITFYSSSINPKLVFIENAAKKFFKLSENLKNLTIINI